MGVIVTNKLTLCYRYGLYIFIKHAEEKNSINRYFTFS